MVVCGEGMKFDHISYTKLSDPIHYVWYVTTRCIEYVLWSCLYQLNDTCTITFSSYAICFV